MRRSRPDLDQDLNHILRPPDYRPHALHLALVATELLSRVAPVMLAPAWLALAAIACWPWHDFRIAAGLLSLSMIVIDGAGLAVLPRARRSFGPVTPPLLALTLLRTSVTFLGGLIWGTQVALLIVTGIQLVIVAVALYATWIEPFRVRVTQASLHSSRLEGRTPLRLLHISDLHVERVTTREEQLLALVEAIDPDLTVLTGDYLSLSSVHDPDARRAAHDLLEQLCQRTTGPVYAITGSPPVDVRGIVPEIFADLDITWLLDQVEHLEIRGHRIRLVGLRCTAERTADAPRLRHLVQTWTEDCFTLLLYHSPDLMPEAVSLGIDLYLCGHTHGGQLRLPLFGAVVTSSAFWKRYEMGRYQEEGTTMYVSRGLGMEGLGAPRARFLSPPEVIVWALSRP